MKQADIIKDLKLLLVKKLGNLIKDVILFGSQANGSSNQFSDFDILIVLNKPYTGKDENIILDLCYEINLKYNILLDVHILSKSEINSVRGRQPVYKNALKSGVYA